MTPGLLRVEGMLAVEGMVRVPGKRQCRGGATVGVVDRSDVTNAAPDDKAKLEYSDAEGLTDAYETLRGTSKNLVDDLKMSTEEFDSQFQPLEEVQAAGTGNPRQILKLTTQASTAATRLRTLRGYISGLIMMTTLTEDLKPEQVELISGVVSN